MVVPSFVYRAADLHGRVVRGTLDGESSAAVAAVLERRQLVPLAVGPADGRAAATAEEPGATTTRIRLRPAQLLEFTRQLKVMLSSGVTLLSTLGVLRQRARGDYRTLLGRIATDIQRGATLADALAAHPRTFDAFYVGTLRAGEAAGVHTEALDELIRFHERRAALRREIVQALTYPAIVSLVLVGACLVMLTVVVPQFQSIFASAGADLPLATRGLLAASALVTRHGAALGGGAAACALALWRLWPQPRFQLSLGLAASRLPLIGRVYYYAGVVQFCRMYALLERAGRPILETLRVIEQMLMPGPLRRLAGEMQKQIAMGSSIAATVEQRAVLPDLVEHMIVVGESAGRMDEMLAAAADHYDAELRVQIRRMTTALEPLLTIAVSALVLGVALAIFQPLWRMNSVLLEH